MKNIVQKLFKKEEHSKEEISLEKINSDITEKEFWDVYEICKTSLITHN